MGKEKDEERRDGWKLKPSLWSKTLEEVREELWVEELLGLRASLQGNLKWLQRWSESLPLPSAWSSPEQPQNLHPHPETHHWLKVLIKVEA